MYVTYFELCWPVYTSNISRKSCSEGEQGDRQRAVGRPNTTQLLYLSLMAEPDTAVIPLKPFEESQCPTASPATCSITIKGYYRHSSILAHAEQATDTTPDHFHALLLCYYFPSIQTPSLCCSLLSICPLLSMLHRLTSLHPSITLSLSFTSFHCCTVSSPLWL